MKYKRSKWQTPDKSKMRRGGLDQAFGEQDDEDDYRPKERVNRNLSKEKRRALRQKEKFNSKSKLK